MWEVVVNQKLKGERKALADISIAQKDIGRHFYNTEIQKYRFYWNSKIENCHTVQQMHTCIWGLGLQEEWQHNQNSEST